MEEDEIVKQLTFDSLRVLHQTSAEKLHYFGCENTQSRYFFEDSADAAGILMDAQCFVILTVKTFNRYQLIFYQDEYRESIREISCVLEMMLELSKTIDYFWNLEPSKAINGPFDTVWDVLAGLASNALFKHRQTLGSSNLHFQSLLTHWNVRRELSPKRDFL